MYEGHADKVLCDQLTGGGVEYPKIEEIYDVVCTFFKLKLK